MCIWSLLFWTFVPAYAGGFGGIRPFQVLPLDAFEPMDSCEIECNNNDGDELFPQGTTNGSCVSGCREIHAASPPSPGVRPTGNNRAFILLEPMTYMIGATGIGITIPAGFVTDYASIPEKLWSLYSPHDQYSRAAIVHDYLYWSQLCSRPQADNLFMIAMIESEVPESTAEKVFAGVRLFGDSSWEDNNNQRKSKMPKVIPIDRKDFPPNWSWEMYREYLMERGVEDPPFTGNEYCNLGDTARVPQGTKPSPIPSNPSFAVRALHGMDSLRLMKGPKSYD
jgi:hypothetical protein